MANAVRQVESNDDARSPDGPDGRDTFDAVAWFDEAVPLLFGYFIVRVGGRVDVAEDLTQETMLSTTSASGRVPDSVPVMAWLYGIARHKLVDHYRREEQDRRRFGRASLQDVIDIGPSSPLGHLDLDAIHTRDDIVATLDQLPPRQCAALVLRYFDGCDVATTAALLDLGEHAAESLLARGRTAFRRLYRERTGEFS
jgi:RNA polymerase sigma-70 factor, ECF subfamily